MYAYLRSYYLASNLALKHLRDFDVRVNNRFKYAFKAGNLAICFLGFSSTSGEAVYRKSAELGCLASIFDLTSDELHFSTRAMSAFRAAVRSIADQSFQEMIFDVLETKQHRKFGFQGLQRGIDAFRIIVRYLGVESHWRSPVELNETGVLLQIVDDVLDRRADFARGELNFLTTNAAQSHLLSLLDWNYQRQLKYGPHSFVLRRVIARAQMEARALLGQERERERQTLQRTQPNRSLG